MEKLIEAFETRVRLTADLKSQVQQLFQCEQLSKNHEILREDQYAQKLYFLESGVIRTYYYHQDKEITSWLYGDNQFFTSWHSFIRQESSFEYIETLEACTIYWITKEKYERLLSSDPLFEKFGRLLVEEQLAFLDFYFKGFLFMTAKEKYNLLVNTYPSVTQKANLGYIASLLGITQETLSRIRVR